MDASAHGAILDQIYDVAAEPAGWSPLLARLADGLGGTSAWLSRLNLADGSGAGVTARLDPEMQRRYEAYYGGLNPYVKSADQENRLGLWRPEVLTGEHMVAEDRLARDEYYNDFMRPQDVHAILVFRLVLDAGASIAVTINRPLRSGPFEAAQVETARSLLGHLVRAVRLGERLEGLRALNANLVAALERSADAALLVDGCARVRFANAAAVALAARGGGVRLRGGKLAAAEVDETRALQAAIARAAGGAAAEGPTGRGAMLALRAGEGRLPLAVSVWPLPRNGPAAPTGRPLGGTVLVTCVDPEARAAPATAALREVFGLTPAEAVVAAAFCEGVAPREIAVRLGVGFNTVRFHLAGIFAKTGVSRQAELALMFGQVARLPH